MASGIGRPPLIRTPSISKANANESAVGISAGVTGEPGVSGVLEVGEIRASSSRSMEASSLRAVSNEAAKPPLCERDLCFIIRSGTTTTGPPSLISLSVAVMEESRRSPGLLLGGLRREEVADGAMTINIYSAYSPLLVNDSGLTRNAEVLESGGVTVGHPDGSFETRRYIRDR